MALIKDSSPKSTSGNYMRVFGNRELGYLISRVQSTVISAGNELEKIIQEKTQSIDDLDTFLKQEIMPDGVFVVHKKQMDKCKTLDFAGAKPDFIIFKRKEKKQQCYLIELKDGDTFDTKKSSGEHQAMRSFISKNASNLQYTVRAHFCCFNQGCKEKIVKGFKNKITKEEAMTGKEFCELLEINYDEILDIRKQNIVGNFSYFLSELVKIEEVRNWLRKNPIL